MFRSVYYRKYSVSFSVLRCTWKRSSSTQPESKDVSLLEKLESKLLYNTLIDNKRLGFKKSKIIAEKYEKKAHKLRDAFLKVEPLPIALKYLSDDSKPVETVEKNDTVSETTKKVTHFPYNETADTRLDDSQETVDSDKSKSLEEQIRQRNESLKTWMTAYDNYEDDLVEDYDENVLDWSINYGTPDPNSVVSNTPCGGCGALLHCKDSAIPGYIPSEIYKNHNKRGASSLESIICQRCYFLKEHNMALQVRVSAEDYPKILTTVTNKRALVVLMVDLIDFPCSIWPGIADILGPKIPIYLVGNKVDLLPQYSTKFLTKVKQNLLNHVKLHGFGSANILGVSLISATTFFGIENLITSLFSLWRFKGDVYLVGCTNVGKSSLFNTLLQSDYCKIQAADLIQRATVSQWPGTTLNLLKFPIMRASGYRLYLRHQRLMSQHRVDVEEKKLRKLNNTLRFASLIGRIDQTLTLVNKEKAMDSFALQGNSNASGRLKLGINENHPDYASGHWCFDTPGVVQPDQIINLLTVDELMYTIPKETLIPQTFCVKAGTSLFIAGLARLDYLEGPGSIRLTVFRSRQLPLTICSLKLAEEVYKECLGTKLFKVPIDDGDRLSKWPGLEAGKCFTVTGTAGAKSSKDIVLSSAGWVAINCGMDKSYNFQAWTPEKRGIFLRDCLLPNAVTFRGSRMRDSVAYK